MQRYMEYEDSARILDSLGVPYEVLPFQFDHEVSPGQPELLQNYLRKCVLDDSLDALKFFSDALPLYRHDGGFRFPQTVNLLTISKQ